MDYTEIFRGHILRLIEEQGLTKQQLAAMADISGSFLTELAKGEVNPTLKVMQSLSVALQIPLPLLLKPLESEEWQTILTVSRVTKEPKLSKNSELPEGYGKVEALLPLHKVYVVNQWEKEARKKLKQRLSNRQS